MKQNRRVSRRRSVFNLHVVHIGGILLAIVGMVILNLLAESTSNQLTKTIREKDAIIQARQAELDRAQARWEAAKSTDNLERALGRRGLVMTPPHANQIIRFDSAGEFLPGQRSVALARQRLATATTAALTRPTPAPSVPSRPAVRRARH